MTRKFINEEQKFDDDGKIDYWSLEEVQQYYKDLRKNEEYNANHNSFEEWLNSQEQFKEVRSDHE